ncbi:MAG: alanine racemase [Emergencia timonensis]|uniref:alanine racemase n=1 Tax=Emergencia timonensis TaxID=1776384 RepID=UPI000837034D|nr:alanine racemase [Emergencia timonensis]WNX88766.1 alanine racemase [Emergencia timonensis]
MTEQREELRDTQVIVDLDKIEENMKLISRMAGTEISVMAVIKANGYGHGAVSIAPTLMKCGVKYLAVATLTEALELREIFPSYPLFILGYTPDRLLHHVVEKNITQTVFSLEQAQLLGSLAKGLNKPARVHIKVDTGFHRLGKEPSAAYADEICKICAVEHVEVEGIFSHLALVNEEENEKQYQTFCNFIEVLEHRGCEFKYKHIADSIATVDYPRYRMNMVRPGALIYGMRGFHIGFLPVQQALTFRTAIAQLHTVPKGEGVSYDYLWKASRNSIVATLPFGYADGYPRNLRDKGYVIVNGIKAPIVGVICMDQCMADVTDVPNVAVGMEAIIYGNGQDGSMTIEEAAKLAGTNKNDIIARIPARPPRKYISKNRF